ncbi:MAG: hypothetical protein LBC61_07680 [Candidatus Peribacteria bacterium]|nr:hypothetical protein [Candidatus Peribacteria bacterium]
MKPIKINTQTANIPTSAINSFLNQTNRELNISFQLPKSPSYILLGFVVSTISSSKEAKVDIQPNIK